MIKYLEKDFFKEIENKKVLVDFYADWCGPCKMLTEVLEEIQDEINIDILKVDVSKFADIAKEYKILSIPTLCIIDNKKILKTHIGYLNPNELKEFIKNS